MKKLIAIVGIAALSAVGCATQVGAGEMAVKVDDYFVIPAGPKVEGCINPETSEFNPVGGFKAYRYPARQISWDATGDQDAEAPATVVVSHSSAPAELKVPVTVTFDLTSDCGSLMEFHKDFGTKYQGWLNENGTISTGWVNLLRYVVGQPLENTLVSIAQKYEWRKIWNDEAVRVEFQNALTQTLPEASRQRTNGTEFFTNFAVTVMKPDPVDDGLKNAIIREQSAVAEARAAEAKGVADANAKKAAAEAEIKAAEAQTELARQEALRRQAVISGYPSVEDYLKALLIDKGGNPYQPVIVPGMPK